MNVEQSSVRYWEIRRIYVGRLRLFCATLILQGVKRRITQYCEVFRQHKRGGTHFHSHMQISAHCVLQAERSGISFSGSESSSGIFLCSCACVGVSPSASQRLLAKRRAQRSSSSVTNVRRSLEHLVTLLKSWSFSKPPASHCTLCHARQRERGRKINNLTPNSE